VAFAKATVQFHSIQIIDLQSLQNRAD